MAMDKNMGAKFQIARAGNRRAFFCIFSNRRQAFSIFRIMTAIRTAISSLDGPKRIRIVYDPIDPDFRKWKAVLHGDHFRIGGTDMENGVGRAANDGEENKRDGDLF